MTALIEAPSDFKSDQQKNRTDWAERRRAWALYHEGLGPLPEPLPELAEPERAVTSVPPVSTSGGQYDGLDWGFARACVKADREHAQKYGRPVEPADIAIVATCGAPSAAQLQAEYERALARRANGAAATTVEALMYSLRERRTGALKEPDTKRRIAQLSEEQLVQVVERLQRLKIVEPWSGQEIDQLFIARTKC
jgi:hypothetical protein